MNKQHNDAYTNSINTSMNENYTTNVIMAYNPAVLTQLGTTSIPAKGHKYTTPTGILCCIEYRTFQHGKVPLMRISHMHTSSKKISLLDKLFWLRDSSTPQRLQEPD